MELIAQLESSPRSLYTGAIGYWSPQGEAMFNVAIRTICAQGSHAVMGIGSGIVADSCPEQEWAEIQLKAGFCTSQTIKVLN